MSLFASFFKAKVIVKIVVRTVGAVLIMARLLCLVAFKKSQFLVFIIVLDVLNI